MSSSVVLVLILLQLKHWYIDFVNQTEREVKSKGNYGEWYGFYHSLKHGLLSAIIIGPFVSIGMMYLVWFIDTFVHYHTDWVKMRFGNRDINTKDFWAQLGLDQFVHQLTYIGLVSVFL